MKSEYVSSPNPHFHKVKESRCLADRDTLEQRIKAHQKRVQREMKRLKRKRAAL